MLAFPGMLVGPADAAGIEVPEDPDGYDPEQFPYFHLFCCAQLGTAMPHPSAHWDNAKVIAGIPIEEVRKVTVMDLLTRGFSASF